MLALTTSGCATKHYVKAQLDPVNSKVSALETKTNAQTDREAADVSRVEQKLDSTDSQVAEAATAAEKANARAAQASQLAQQNQSAIAANQSAIAANQSAVAANTASITTLGNAMNYSLVATGNVTFAFNKSNLGKTDEAALDDLIQQARSNPRAVFELIGFTDRVGTKEYNLALSRRRAESVQRYLVQQGVSLRGIHIIGLGKEPVPPGLLEDVQAVDSNATSANSRSLARRVLIRVYTPNASVPSAESATLQK